MLFPSARSVQQGNPLGPVLFAVPSHPAILEAPRFTDSSHPLGHPEGPPCPGPMPAGQVTCTRNFCDPLNTNTLSVREDPALEA